MCSELKTRESLTVATRFWFKSHQPSWATDRLWWKLRRNDLKFTWRVRLIVSLSSIFVHLLLKRRRSEAHGERKLAEQSRRSADYSPTSRWAVIRKCFGSKRQIHESVHYLLLSTHFHFHRQSKQSKSSSKWGGTSYQRCRKSTNGTCRLSRTNFYTFLRISLSYRTNRNSTSKHPIFVDWKIRGHGKLRWLLADCSSELVSFLGNESVHMWLAARQHLINFYFLFLENMCEADAPEWLYY